MIWPDILIAAVILIAVLKGYKRGFVLELSGFVALAASVIVPWFYRGSLDGFFQSMFHLGSGSAHVVAMFLVGLATYVAILLIARALNTVTKLPFLGLGNALGGAAIGIVKAVVLIWLLLYVALFFPLSPDIRADLHRSVLVGYETSPNDRVDGAIIGTFPWFARPFAHYFFAHHRV
jgi:membrane protein required for colicin V production